MKKIMLAITMAIGVFFGVFWGTNTHAAVGVVVADNVCGNRVVIQVSDGSFTGRFVGATYHSGATLRKGDSLRLVVSSPGMRYIAFNGNLQGQYWINSPVSTLQQATDQLCAAPLFPL